MNWLTHGTTHTEPTIQVERSDGLVRQVNPQKEKQFLVNDTIKWKYITCSQLLLEPQGEEAHVALSESKEPEAEQHQGESRPEPTGSAQPIDKHEARVLGGYKATLHSKMK